VHIETLALNGYRGAHDLELTLHPKLNVFYGVNGCGKTTLLDAAAVMLSWAVNRIRHAGAAGRKIQEADIANGKPAAALELSVQTKSGSVAWKLVKTRQGHSNGGSQTLLTGLNEFVKGLQAERPTESYGKNVDRILEDLMGLNTTRPDQVSAGIHDLFVTIDQKRLDEARRKISKLKAEIGEDPELVKAEVLIICSKTSPGTRP